MKVHRLVVTAALLAAAAAGAGAAAETWAITGARAWTMTAAAPVEDATVIVTDGRIVSVVAGGAVPAGARVVPAAGRTVTPALVDAATQVGLGEVGGIAEERAASVARGPLGAAFDIAYAFDPADQSLRQARADGVAWAAIYPDGSAGAPFDGRGAIVRLGVADATLARPHAAVFATIGGASAAAAGGSRAAAWQGLYNALAEARRYRPATAAGRPRDQLLNHLDAAALQPVLARVVPLVVATNRASDVAQAIALARDERIRVTLFGGAEAWVHAAALARAGIAVILDPLADLPDSYDTIGARRDNAALLARAGVRIAFSVSVQGIYRSWNAGPSLREGAGNAVAAGLGYRDALAAVTSGAAAVIGLGPHAGTLAPGAAADLVVWDGDPLEPASAPVHVYIDGVAVSPVTRQHLLRDRYAPPRARLPSAQAGTELSLVPTGRPSPDARKRTFPAGDRH